MIYPRSLAVKATYDVHVVADTACELHQEWPTKPDPDARCGTCRGHATPPGETGT